MNCVIEKNVLIATKEEHENSVDIRKVTIKDFQSGELYLQKFKF